MHSSHTRRSIPAGSVWAPLPARSPDVVNRCEVAASADPTTTVPPVTDLAAHVAGFIAAEGHFGANRTATRFRLAVGLAAADRGSCQLLLELFRVGTITETTRRQAHHDDVVSWQVQALPQLVDVVVPFMDHHLPPCHKREQYIIWRTLLLQYWEHGARRVHPCSVDGCTASSRCKRLCRHHDYLAFGR